MPGFKNWPFGFWVYNAKHMNLLIRLFGFPATLLHGDPLFLDRWRWLKNICRRGTTIQPSNPFGHWLRSGCVFDCGRAQCDVAGLQVKEIGY